MDTTKSKISTLSTNSEQIFKAYFFFPLLIKQNILNYLSNKDAISLTIASIGTPKKGESEDKSDYEARVNALEAEQTLQRKHLKVQQALHHIARGHPTDLDMMLDLVSTAIEN